MYLAIKHFRHFVEGRQFYITTDHKPLTFALSTKSSKLSLHQTRHLDYIAQFTTDIRYTRESTTLLRMPCPVLKSMLYTPTMLSI